MDTLIKSMDACIKSFGNEIRRYFAKRKDFIDMVKVAAEQTHKVSKSTMNIQGYYYTEMKQPYILLDEEFQKIFGVLLKVSPEIAYSKISQDDTYLAKQRMKMLGTDTMVTDKQFQSKCFEMFRNNCNKETVVCYNQCDIENIINKYLSPTVYMDNLNDLYIEIKADYEIGRAHV